MRLLPISLLVCSAALFVGGCAKKSVANPVEDANPYRNAIQEKLLPDGLVLEEVDLNNDGRPEIFNHYRLRADAQRLLVRKDADLNNDGTPDTKSWYDDRGGLTLEEMDQDFDGRVDLWDHYQDTNADGVPERVSSERDSNYDGKADIFTFYRDGVPVRKERDTNGDGQIDAWEKFDSEGKVVKAGRDTNYDGSVDQRD